MKKTPEHLSRRRLEFKMTSSNRILIFLFRAWGCLKRSMSDGLNCLVASLPVDEIYKCISRFSDVLCIYFAFVFEDAECIWMYLNVTKLGMFGGCVLLLGNKGEFFAFVPGVPEENVEQPKWAQYPLQADFCWSKSPSRCSAPLRRTLDSFGRPLRPIFFNKQRRWSWSLQQGGSNFCMLDMICTTFIFAYHQWWHIASEIQPGNRSFLISDGLLANIVIFFLNWHTQNLYSFGVELLESAPKVRVIHAMRCRNTLLGRHMDCSIENL